MHIVCNLEPEEFVEKLLQLQDEIMDNEAVVQTDLMSSSYDPTFSVVIYRLRLGNDVWNTFITSSDDDVRQCERIEDILKACKRRKAL